MTIANLKVQKTITTSLTNMAASPAVAVIGHNQPTAPVEIDPKSWPDKSPRGEGVLCTVANVRHMLAENGVVARYNIIRKRVEVEIPWITGKTDNADAVAMTHIVSLANLYMMPAGSVLQMTDAIADEYAYNPAADWINSRAWDGEDRLPSICATITPTEDCPTWWRDKLMRKWLLSIAAAALMPDGFKCRGVLTLQGAQGIGKTSWGLKLIDDDRLRKQLIKTDHHLDAGDKDSQLGAIAHLIVEIGELDSSLKRDISRLKGFLTSGSDKIRRPYARVTSETQRRTVFYATVNAPDFLVDTTGNSRFWVIACESIDHEHDIEMQQVFAQCAALLREGEQWWLTAAEEQLLESQNSKYRSVSLVRDKLEATIDREVTDLQACPAMTATEIITVAGIERPTSSQVKECAALMREWFGQSKRYNGINKWRVPVRKGVSLVGIADEDNDQEQAANRIRDFD